MNKLTILDLIALGEGFTTEFKRSMPSDLGREICAFANATGGAILIGVDDASVIVGVMDHNRLKPQVSRASTRCTTAAERNCPTGAMTRESRGSSKQGDPSGTGGDS